MNFFKKTAPAILLSVIGLFMLLTVGVGAVTDGIRWGKEKSNMWFTSPGGNVWVDGYIDIGASKLRIAETAVTATAAEINAMAGQGLSGAELAFLDGVTAGTRSASKAAVVGADSTIDAWDVTGALTGMKSIITVTTDTTLTAAQCKGTFIYISTAASDTTVTLTVPTLVAGYDFIVCDNDVTAGAGVEVQMSAGDKVNGGTAAKKYKHGNAETAVGTAHFISADVTDLILVGAPTDSGNWANNNS